MKSVIDIKPESVEIRADAVRFNGNIKIEEETK